MTKQQITDLITAPDSSLYYLSAQAYGLFTREDKELLREVVTDAGQSYADYEAGTVSLFPKASAEKVPTWREK